MKKFFYSAIFAITSILLFSECNTGGKESVSAPIEAPLRPSLIYYPDSVKKYTLNKPEYDSLASQHLDQANDLSPGSLEKAIHHVKQSITYKPTREAYIKLGELLCAAEEFTEAHEAYNTLINVFEHFDKKTYFDMLYAAVMDPESNGLYPFLHGALDQGISIEEIRKHFLEDPRFDPIRETKDFKNLLLYDMSDLDMSRDSLTFENFLKVFNIRDGGSGSRNYPFVIDMDRLTDISRFYTGEVWWPFRHFLPESQGNLDFSFLEYKRLPDPSEGISAVIYAIDTSAHGARKEMRMVYYRLVTYDFTGEVIDNMIIAKHLGEEICTAEIVSGNSIKLSVFTRTWKKPFNCKDMDNEVVSTEPSGMMTVTINKKGKIAVTDGA